MDWLALAFTFTLGGFTGQALTIWLTRQDIADAYERGYQHGLSDGIRD